MSLLVSQAARPAARRLISYATPAHAQVPCLRIALARELVSGPVSANVRA
jgi:hypothetical protein